MGASLAPAADWTIVSLAATADGTLALNLEPTNRTAACPTCGTVSERRHSRYIRRPRDLPWRGTAVRVRITVRRFFCDQPTCPRRTFAESCPDMLPRKAQRAVGATDLLRECGLRAGGEGGARLARKAGVPTSPDTLLRIVRAAAPEAVPTPRVLGVDDFSLRRGRRYATILVDLERHQPVDIVDTREAAPLVAWLQTHPGVEILVRDRAEAYAEAGREGAPDAVQVADRFHLVANASAALDEVLRSHRRFVEVPAASPSSAETGVITELVEPVPGPEPTAPVRLTRAAQEHAAAEARRQTRWAAVHQRREQGHGIRQIARELGLHRKTVHRLLAAPVPPARKRRVPRPSGLHAPSLQPYAAYLEGRWQAGCTNISQLYRELVGQGYTGSRSLVYAALAPWRGPRPPPDASGRRGHQRLRPRRYKVRWLCLRPPDQLTADERSALDQYLREEPAVACGHALVQTFRRIIHDRDVPGLRAWLQAATDSGLGPFISLARGIEYDWAAVEAALRLPWSNGPVEGHNHRVKLLKRQGYGRCSLPQLRARVVAA